MARTSFAVRQIQADHLVAMRRQRLPPSMHCLAVTDFMLKMQKVKDSRIMDLWWAVGNTLKADCSRPAQPRQSVIAHK